MRRWALREIRQSDSVLNMCVSKKDKNTFEHEPKKKYLVSTFIRILPAACAGCSVAIRIQLHNPDSRWISAYQMLAGALQPLVLLMIISSGCCISAIAATMSGIFQVTTFDGIWRQTADIRLYLQPAWGKKKKIVKQVASFHGASRDQIRNVQISLLLLLFKSWSEKTAHHHFTLSSLFNWLIKFYDFSIKV